jgi:hypothetical protein
VKVVPCNYCQQADRWYDEAQSNLESEYKSGLYICGLWAHERAVYPEGDSQKPRLCVPLGLGSFLWSMSARATNCSCYRNIFPTSYRKNGRRFISYSGLRLQDGGIIWSRGSSVSIVTRLRAERPLFDCRQVLGFISLHCVQTDSGAHPERPEREADH